MPLKVGDTFTLNVNQGDREALVLARIGNQVLIEYAMPAGSTAMQILTDGGENRGKSVNYTGIPIKWLRAIVEEDNEWEGNPQRGRKPKSAKDELAERTRRFASDLVGAVHSEGVLNTLASVAGASTLHVVGCQCGSCQCAMIADEWDPRMGPK
jgi:hypothetical protein